MSFWLNTQIRGNSSFVDKREVKEKNEKNREFINPHENKKQILKSMSDTLQVFYTKWKKLKVSEIILTF